MDLNTEVLQSNTKYIIEEDIVVCTSANNLTKNNKKYSTIYNIIARVYDVFSWLYFCFYGSERKAREEFLETVIVEPGNKVLEVSVGTGINVGMLPDNASYFGVDISHGMLLKCLQNFKQSKVKISLFQAEAENLPFKDNYFDSIFHVGGINFFNDKRKAIEEMVRVAKPGTIITIVDETNKFFDTFSWIPFIKTFFIGGKVIKPPLELLPKNIKDIEIKEVVKGNYWRLSFRKP